MTKNTTKHKAQSLVMLTDPTGAAAEAYRALRVNLTYASLDAALKTLLVVAPAPEARGESQTEVAANLAVAVAQAGHRVILVDANLRQPQLHSFFGQPNEGGLTQAILAPEEAPLQATGVEGLSLLTAGAALPNPADLLSSRQMATLLAALAQQADLVLLVAPPVKAVSDTLVLAAKSDGVLLVARAGQTRRDRLTEAKKMLERVDARVLGAVLVDAPGTHFTGY